MGSSSATTVWEIGKSSHTDALNATLMQKMLEEGSKGKEKRSEKECKGKGGRDNGERKKGERWKGGRQDREKEENNRG